MQHKTLGWILDQKGEIKEPVCKCQIRPELVDSITTIFFLLPDIDSR